MRGDKICAEKQVTNAGPQRSESGLSLNMLPGDAMYGRKEEGAPRRTDQIIFPLDNSSARNANQADRASAIGTVVGRLEIDRDEGRKTRRGREGNTFGHDHRRPLISAFRGCRV